MKEKWFGNICAMTIMLVIFSCLAILTLTGLFTIYNAVIHWLYR